MKLTKDQVDELVRAITHETGNALIKKWQSPPVIEFKKVVEIIEAFGSEA